MSVLLLWNRLRVRPKVGEAVLEDCSFDLGLREDSDIFE